MSNLGYTMCNKVNQRERLLAASLCSGVPCYKRYVNKYIN